MGSKFLTIWAIFGGFGKNPKNTPLRATIVPPFSRSRRKAFQSKFITFFGTPPNKGHFARYRHKIRGFLVENEVHFLGPPKSVFWKKWKFGKKWQFLQFLTFLAFFDVIDMIFRGYIKAYLKSAVFKNLKNSKNVIFVIFGHFWHFWDFLTSSIFNTAQFGSKFWCHFFKKSQKIKKCEILKNEIFWFFNFDNKKWKMLHFVIFWSKNHDFRLLLHIRGFLDIMLNSF